MAPTKRKSSFPQERRKYPRLPLNAAIDIRQNEHTKSYSGHLKNFSPGGICFCSNQLFEKGNSLTIDITKNKKNIRIVGKVIWSCQNLCDTDCQNKYATGIKISGGIPGEELSFLQTYLNEIITEIDQRWEP